MNNQINPIEINAKPIVAGEAVKTIENTVAAPTHTPVMPPKYAEPGKALDDLYYALSEVDFINNPYFEEKGKPKISEKCVIAIDELVRAGKESNRNMVVIDDTFRIFNGRNYERHDNSEMMKFLSAAARRMSWNPVQSKFYANSDKLYKQLRKMTRRERRERSRERVLLNFPNGTLEIDRNGFRFREHRAEDLLTSCATYEYNPQAVSPKFDAFIDEMLPDKQSQDLLFDFLAVVLLPFVKCEKVLFLHGEGRNGKSVIFEIVKKLFGESNVSNYTVEELTNDKSYCLIDIMDKLVNYGPDVELSMNTSALKTLASGEEKMVRQIYQKQRTMKVYARQMYNTNGVFEKGFEVTDAIKARLDFIPFKVKVSEEKKDLELAQKLIAECAGIMNRVLRHVDKVLANGGKLTECEASRSLTEEMFSYIDSIDDFLINDNIAPCGETDVPLQQFYSDYVRYCREFHLPVCGYNKFASGLRKRGFEVKKVGGKARQVNAHTKPAETSEIL